MKKFAIAIGVLFVLVLAVIGGGVYYTLSSLDGLVKSAIEKYGSEMTGCRVRVGSVEILLMEGSGTIRNLRVANPSGFSDADAFELGEITLDIDVESLTKSPIVLDRIVIAKPQVVFEVDANGQTNIQAIQKNLERYSPPSGSTSSSGGEAGAGTDVKLRITRFRFDEGRVAADTSAVGGKKYELALPAIDRKDVGGRSGATGAEIGQEIMTAYSTRIAKVVASQQLDRLLDEKVGGEEGEAAKKLLKKFMK